MASAKRSKRAVRRKRLATSHGVKPDLDADAPLSEEDLPPLTKRQIAALERSIRDIDDRTRYLIVSHFAPGFTLYYDVSDGMFPMNDPASGTLFKRREQAAAVQALLGANLRVVRCECDAKGKVVLDSLPARYGRSVRSRSRAKR